MKTAIAASLPAIVLMFSPVAQAEDAYMNGVFGVGPGYTTIKGSAGCAKGCQKIRYNNFSDTSAQRAINAWVNKNGTSGNTIRTYSLSTNGAIKYLNENLDDQNEWILIGSPSAPGSTNPERIELTNPHARVTFITVENDSVAQPDAPKASFSTHMNGYRYLDSDDPKSSETEGNVTDNVYERPKRFNLFNPSTWGKKSTNKDSVDGQQQSSTEKTASAESSTPRARTEERQTTKRNVSSSPDSDGETE